MADSQAVSVDELREMFNRGGYWKRVTEGKLKQVVKANGHPAPKPGLPKCTRSRLCHLVTLQGHPVASVHYYMPLPPR